MQGKDTRVHCLCMTIVSCKCTHVHLLCILMSSIFHAHAGFVTSDFRNQSGCVVVMCLLAQVHTTNLHATKKIHATFTCVNISIHTCAHTPVLTLMCKVYIKLYCTVQLNSNLTLACVSLAETQLIFKFIQELVASAQTCLRSRP